MIRIKDITDFLDTNEMPYTYIGDSELKIHSYVSIENIAANLMSWIKDEKKMQGIMRKDITNSLIVSLKFDTSTFEKSNFIFCDNPKAMYFTILNQFFHEETKVKFISATSVVETKSIGKQVYIGHHCYIGPEVVISDNVRIENNVSIQGKVTIGKDSIIRSGVVIGTEGFGYFENTDGINVRVPHFGGVIIGEDVEIGANTCIDRGTLGDVEIGNHVKINNLCHIAHNVIIEDHVMIGALVIISGSVSIKKNVYISPGATIRNQVTIGANSLIGLGSVVVKDVEDNVVIVGVPGKKIRNREGEK
ncbi:MAG: UDP-3-O-(3-hydroxymyristoyl)glucosamine N-acyltransferase [Paenisporosarcina sp.]